MVGRPLLLSLYFKELGWVIFHQDITRETVLHSPACLIHWDEGGGDEGDFAENCARTFIRGPGLVRGLNSDSQNARLTNYQCLFFLPCKHIESGKDSGFPSSALTEHANSTTVSSPNDTPASLICKIVNMYRQTCLYCVHHV